MMPLNRQYSTDQTARLAAFGLLAIQEAKSCKALFIWQYRLQLTILCFVLELRK
jgi:hypothetical protein